MNLSYHSNLDTQGILRCVNTDIANKLEMYFNIKLLDYQVSVLDETINIVA